MSQLTKKIDSDKSGLLFYLMALTGAFILLEISVITLGSDFYLGDYKYVANHINVPRTVLPGIIFFLGSQLFLHVTYLFIIWTTARCIGVVFPRINSRLGTLGIVLWLLGIVGILLANQYLFPNSKFTIISSKLVSTLYIKWALAGVLSLCSVAVLCALIGGILVCWRHMKLTLGMVGVASGLSFIIYEVSLSGTIRPISAATAVKPNVILIGVDSLRPDFLGYFGGAKWTPHIDSFLNHAAVFSEALTPLARTYPAWVSILTGEYPKKNNVRTNLQEQTDMDMSQTLSYILQKQGYETVFAMDETRYSNIDHHFGFDRMVTPPIGLNDFLVGTFNDFPMSNLIVNTPLGKYLFPYSYANRPVLVTYDPNSFLKDLQRTLEMPRSKPLFLIAHFCLPHLPYIWAGQKWSNKYVFNYRSAIKRADVQVYDLLKILKKNNLLEHSIVVLLSDHGEAMGLPGDRITEADLFVPAKRNKLGTLPIFYPGNKSEKVNQSAGHGTDVLGLPQYHTLLAFRFFGMNGQQTHQVSGRVSLLDIKPTLLELLGIKISPYSGKSLVNYINGKKTAVTAKEHFFIESDFSPESVRTVYPEMRKVLFEGIDFFHIDPVTTRLTIKKSMVDTIISSKQYADFYGPWVLALYPQNKKTMLPILVNLKSGLWTNDLRTNFAKKSPADHMLRALKNFYGEDIKEIENLSP